MRILLSLIACFAASLASLANAQSPEPPGPDDAPIALLVDLATGQSLLSREADRRFLPASMTKVMTMFTAFEMMESGELQPRQIIAVDDEMVDEWSGTGSSMFLRRGDRVSVDELLAAIATVSANDGSVALARGASGSTEGWLKAMNGAASRIGMHDSRFGTPNGWPDEGATFTTAQDLAVLAKAMITQHPARYEHYFGREGFAHNGVAQANRDPVSGLVRGADGIKTGFTNEAGYGFLGSALRDGRRLVMVIAGAPDEATRARASRDLLEWGFESFDTKVMFYKDELVGEARVQGGEADRVDLQAPFPLLLALPKNGEAAPKLDIVYAGPLEAPVTKGNRVAWLRVTMENGRSHRLPLVAVDAVDEAGPFDRITSGIAGLLS